MAASDAIPVPRKNTAFRFYFAIRKPADSSLITTWTGMDSEVSLDGAAFSDCTNEATEIGTSGIGYIDLTASEMNADSVVLKVTVTNTGAVPLVFTFYPESAGDYRVADNQKVDVNTIKTQTVTAAAGITFPASVASQTEMVAKLLAIRHMDAVWITGTGASGTADGTGTFDTPVNNLADALTIATARNLRVLRIRGDINLGSLASSFTGKILEAYGHKNGYQLNLNGQDIEGSSFIGGSLTGAYVSEMVDMHRVEIVSVTTGQTELHLSDSDIGTLTIGNNDFDLNCDRCNGDSQVIDINSKTGVTVSLYDHHGTVEFRNIPAGGTTIHLTGSGKVTFAATCAGGTALIAGHWDVVNSGSVTVTKTAAIPGALVVVPDTQKVDIHTIKTNPVVNAGTVTFPAGATLASTTNITAASGVTISGTTTTLDALQTALNSAHGAGSWATAIGFSTHSAADVWAVGSRTLTAFGFTVTTADVTLATSQPNYAPAKAGDAMTLTAAYDSAKTAATQTSVDDLPTNAELATALASADDATLAAIAALNNLSAAQVTAAVPTVLQIQNGLATAANQTVMIDGIGFITSALMGTISDAGTAAETYVISFGGATYTVDFTGLDVTGNRGGVTRTKT